MGNIWYDDDDDEEGSVAEFSPINSYPFFDYPDIIKDVIPLRISFYLNLIKEGLEKNKIDFFTEYYIDYMTENIAFGFKQA